MISVLPAPLAGSIVLLLVVLNTLFWVIPLYLSFLVKLPLPAGALRDRVSRAGSWLAQQWAYCNTLLAKGLLPTQWDIKLDAEVSREGQYLVCANHQSWNDIVVLMYAFGRDAPFFKFFLKQELIWVPLLGWAWWGLDYPFMKRYSKEQIEKNPALKGTDLATTRKACAAFRNQPALILNFLEGTRFTKAKQAQQQSPYRHLLKPKAGGFAFTLTALGDKLDGYLDVTIAYPDGAQGVWAYLSGQVRKVKVEVRRLMIPPEFSRGDYENDAAFRQKIQNWVADLWAQKDAQISRMLAAG